MRDNKLIANFMFEETMPINQMRYHSSWDWLMPVIEKIKILVMEDDSNVSYVKVDGGYLWYLKGDELYNSEEWDNITHTLVQIEIKSVYQAVVEFIKEYNQNN